jgi:hypothetical protein
MPDLIILYKIIKIIIKRLNIIKNIAVKSDHKIYSFINLIIFY